MSGATQAREKRAKTRGDAWEQRPAGEPSNSPVSKYGWLVQHAMIQSDGIVYKALEALRPNAQRRLSAEKGSYTRISLATAPFTHDGRPMPRRTVAHRMVAMRRKKIIVEWETRATTSPIGHSWELRPFTDVLQTWHDDPDVFTPKNRAFYVRGKDRHLVTPMEAEARHLNTAVAETNPAAHAGAIALDEPAAPAAKGPPSKPVPPPDLEELKIALIRVCGAADAKDAKYVWGVVAEACGTRQPPPVMDIAAMVYAIGDRHEKAGSRRPLDLPILKMRIGGQISAWLLWQQEEAQAATGTGGPRRPGFSPGDPRA